MASVMAQSTSEVKANLGVRRGSCLGGRESLAPPFIEGVRSLLVPLTTSPGAETHAAFSSDGEWWPSFGTATGSDIQRVCGAPALSSIMGCSGFRDHISLRPRMFDTPITPFYSFGEEQISSESTSVFDGAGAKRDGIRRIG